MNEEYKVVTLADGTKWFVVAETDYKKGKYQYAIQLSDNYDLLDKVQVMRIYEEDNQEFFLVVDDQNLLKKVMPLLVPETKEYINNPGKLKELIGEN